MLIIMGTSLKVHGLKKLVKDFARTVHQSLPTGSPKNKKMWTGKVIFVNRTPPAGEWADIIDYHVAGETDTWVEKVVEDWKKMRPADWEVQKTLVATNGEISPFKVVKDVAVAKTKSKWLRVIRRPTLTRFRSWQEETRSRKHSASRTHLEIESSGSSFTQQTPTIHRALLRCRVFSLEEAPCRCDQRAGKNPPRRF